VISNLLYGVPQGTILFSIYINDLFEVDLASKIYLMRTILLFLMVRYMIDQVIKETEEGNQLLCLL